MLLNGVVVLTFLTGLSFAKKFKHVAVFSIDGLHSSDVEKYLQIAPNSNISKLLSTGFEYTNAWTSAPSDSFPGTIAQYTGASPRTHGVWYDDIWDRSVYPKGSNCTGPPGAEGILHSLISIVRNSLNLFVTS
jgi:predicted AlkP superfamily pyrophosphatase or phosphodiesterase